MKRARAIKRRRGSRWDRWFRSSSPCFAGSCAWPIHRPGMHLMWPRAPFTGCSKNSFFNPGLEKKYGDDWYLLPTYYLVIVVLGLGSFLLNVRRFSWARFLPFAVMAAVWAAIMHVNAIFALVFSSGWWHRMVRSGTRIALASRGGWGRDGRCGPRVAGW